MFQTYLLACIVGGIPCTIYKKVGDFFFQTVLVFSVSALCPNAQRNISLISDSNCKRYCGKISPELIIVVRLMSFAICAFYTKFHSLKFALELSCFWAWSVCVRRTGRPSSLLSHWAVVAWWLFVPKSK